MRPPVLELSVRRVRHGHRPWPCRPRAETSIKSAATERRKDDAAVRRSMSPPADVGRSIDDARRDFAAHNGHAPNSAARESMRLLNRPGRRTVRFRLSSSATPDRPHAPSASVPHEDAPPSISHAFSRVDETLAVGGDRK